MPFPTVTSKTVEGVGGTPGDAASVHGAGHSWRERPVNDARRDPLAPPVTTTVAAVALAVVPAAANGFGRFAYGLVLPAMQRDLGWSALTSGSLGAANAAGYLAGAAVADRVLAVTGERAAVVGSLAVCAAAVLACAVTGNVPSLLALRLAAGAAAAVAFVAGAMVLTRHAATSAGRAGDRLLGLYFAGPGLGIAVSAPLVTPVAASGGWRACWLLLGGLCAGCVLTAGWALRRLPAPADRGSPRAGRDPHRRRGHRPWRRRIGPLLVSYGLFGAGYIGFMTFSVAYLRAAGRTVAQLTWFWSVLGMAGVVIALVVVTPLSRVRGGGGVASLTAVTALASVLPLLSPAWGAALTAAAAFGTMFAITAVTTACARHHLPPDRWPAAVAGLTTAFGAGQCAGPLLSGALSDGPHGLRAGLLAGTALLALSAVCALSQRPTVTGGNGAKGAPHASTDPVQNRR